MKKIIITASVFMLIISLSGCVNESYSDYSNDTVKTIETPQSRYNSLVRTWEGIIILAGWDEAAKMMKKGSIATVIIPSSLGYDSTGYFDQRTGKYGIPPYSPLKFDIQLLEYKSKK